MLIDTHAHLNFKAFNNDLSKVIKRARTKGVQKIIIPGAKLDSSQKALEIARKYNFCFAAIGIHPHHVEEYINLGKNTVREKLKKLLISSFLPKRLKKNNQNFLSERKSFSQPIVAIGEIGLDYHTYKGYPVLTQKIKNKQKELLILQIEIALEYDLPIIFHCRDAYHDLLEIVKTYANKIRGGFHCFSGEKKHLENILNWGFYVGFDGNLTYPENKELQKLAKYTPLNHLFLESDSPFLTPLPYRGKRNEPAYLFFLAKKIAEIHQKTLKEIMEITSSNALKLFKI